MKAIPLITLLLALNAHADERDPWFGKDKAMHFAGGAVIGATVTAITDDRRYGFAAGTAVAVAKELYDAQHRDKHTPSFKDIVATMAGTGVGVFIPGLIVTPKAVVYTRSF